MTRTTKHTARDSFFSRMLRSSKSLTAAALLAAQALACSSAPMAEDEIQARCLVDADCASGELCSSDYVCEPTGCQADADCPVGTSCAPNGYCLSVLDQGPNGDGVVDFPGGDEGECDPSLMCVSGEFESENETPTIMLVIDQSGSMDWGIGGQDDGSTSRWEMLKSALVDPDTGIIAGLQDDVRFGVALFSSDARSGGACPIVDGLSEVQVDFGNYDQIVDAYNQASPHGDTPTAESLAVVSAHLQQLDVPGPKAIVLVTDGEPDTCDNVDSSPEADAAVVANVEAAHDAGISTYVLSIGSDTVESHLQDVANAGVGIDDNSAEQAPYFKANDQAELQAELEAAITSVGVCTFALDADVADAVVSQGVVQVDGETLEYGTDWQLSGSRTIELLGDACPLASAGSYTVNADFPCECEPPVIDESQFVH